MAAGVRASPKLFAAQPGRNLHQLTRWVLRGGRFRGLATQPVKRAAWEGRGNPCADLSVSSGTS
jgi:hypothetical protein